MLAAGTTAMAGLAAFGLLAAGCSTGGTGTRDEGEAHTDKVSHATPSPSASSEAPFKKVNAVQLLKADPKVSERVKADLKPCVKSEYPIDVSYGHLTGATGQDVVVNVMTCGDAVGLGSYVYRADGSSYDNVFTSEEAPVYAEIDRGDLVVTRQMYAKGDKPAFASSEIVTTYRWSGTKFSAHDQVENDFSKAVGNDEGTEPPVPPSP
ncbi:hypothetical protein AB0G73_37745 [Streptomyces sp. NPDC020719]|uniref:hypothetical protein n=1 Tax=unclassified Streptomyces TaxID=2593676 RepID=UPI0033C35939